MPGDKRTAVLDPKMLELLVCPVTRGPLVYNNESEELVSKSAHMAYPVRDGVPILLASQARALED